MTLEQILAESVAAAENREGSTLDVALIASSERVVLCGAGALGSKISAILCKHGRKPLAFADQDIRRQGEVINGIVVLSPENAVALYGANSLFIVSIFRGSGDLGLHSRVGYYRAKGCTAVISFLPVLWKYPELLPHFGIQRPSVYLLASDRIQKANMIWSDATSRETYRQQLLWRITGDFTHVSSAAPDQYFPSDLFSLLPDERFVDGGAYDGDTIARLRDQYCTVWAIEPDPKNCARLRKLTDPRIHVVECALGNANTRSRFSASGTVAAAVEETGEHIVDIRKLDDLDLGNPTFLKLDIEGSEFEALQGGEQLMRDTQLLVAVCLYHRPEHLWAIPLFLSEILRQHRFFLRCHQNDGFELVMYAVPHQRCHHE